MSAGTLASAAGQVADRPGGAGAAAPAPTAGGASGIGELDAGRVATAGSAAVSGSGTNASGAGGAAAGTGDKTSSEPGFRCPAGPFDAPALAGASALRVAGFPPLDAFNDSGNLRTNVEGPVWIANKLYVSEFAFTPAPESRILSFDPLTKSVAIELAHAGSNGLAVDASGTLIATNHVLGAIVRLPFPLGMPEVLIGSYDGQRFDSPNDLAIRSDGTIYFSDPDYQAPASRPQAKTRVYRIAPGARALGNAASVIDDTRSQPNGVTLSADERTLYVSGADGIYSYPVLADGDVVAGTGTRVNAFAGSSDGLGMDCAGNLYATAGQRIVVLTAAGVELGTIAVPQAESVTNVAFGGAEHKTLFVTSMGSGNQRGLFQVELNVPGLPY